MSTLTSTLAPMRNLMPVIIIVMTLYAIMGVQLFNGAFYSCSDPSYLTRQNCTANNEQWVNAAINFDNIGAAYSALFVLATRDGWTRIMWQGIDAVGPDQAPVVNNALRVAPYFISFVVIMGVFFTNLFVSIVVVSYQQAKGSTRPGSRFLTNAQNGWLKSQHAFLRRVPLLDYDLIDEFSTTSQVMFRVRAMVRLIVRNPLFDAAVYCFIVMNFLVMAIDQYPKNDAMGDFSAIANAFFVIIFATEAGLKVISESRRRYFASRWNRFDFFIVSLSVVALFLESILFSSSTSAAFFKTLRVLRLLRLIRKSRRLQNVLKRFMIALYSLNNIAAILFLLFFVFGVMGITLFGHVQRLSPITHIANFESLPNALLMMLRLITGGDWRLIMMAYAMQAPTCDDLIGGCGVPVASQLFFMSFMFVGMFVMVNLFVAVIFESFSAASNDSADYMTDADATQFIKLWLHFDPERTFRIESKYLVSLLRAIPEKFPLGFGVLPTRRRLQYELVYVDALGLREVDGLLELQDIMHAMCQRAYREELPLKRTEELTSKSKCRFRTDERDRFKPVRRQYINPAWRFAVQILEAYFLRRVTIKARQHHFRRIREHQEAALLATRRSENAEAVDTGLPYDNRASYGSF